MDKTPARILIYKDRIVSENANTPKLFTKVDLDNNIIHADETVLQVIETCKLECRIWGLASNKYANAQIRLYFIEIIEGMKLVLNYLRASKDIFKVIVIKHMIRHQIL